MPEPEAADDPAALAALQAWLLDPEGNRLLLLVLP